MFSAALKHVMTSGGSGPRFQHITGTFHGTLATIGSYCWGVRVSPDGKFLVASDNTGTASFNMWPLVWNPDGTPNLTSMSSARQTSDTNQGYGIGIRASNNHIVVPAFSGATRVYSHTPITLQGTLTGTTSSSYGSPCAVSSDSRYVASVAGTTVGIWDNTFSGSATQSFTIDQSDVIGMEFVTYNGSTELHVLGGSGTIQVRNPATGSLIHSVQATNYVSPWYASNPPYFYSTGNFLYFRGNSANTGVVRLTRTSQTSWSGSSYTHSSTVQQITASPDGERTYFTSGSTLVGLNGISSVAFDVSSGVGNPFDLSVCPVGRALFIAAYNLGVRVFV